MQKIQKLFSMFVLLALGFLLCMNTAEALEFTEIKVNGVEYINTNDIIHVDRGDDVEIRVELVGIDSAICTLSPNCDEERVRVKAWIGGYKYDEIDDSTNRFTVLEDTTYVKTLNLKIPHDLEATDDYTLHIESYGPQGESIKDELFTLKITPIEDMITIQDVILNPGLNVKAGKPLYVTVRAENLGENKQEDVRVKISIPELGISTRTYIDELCSTECCNEDSDDCCNEDDETSSSSDELMLKIPENAKEGTYELVVEIEYDRFHKTTKETYLLFVEAEGTEDTTTPGSNDNDVAVKRLINVDTATQEVEQGKGVIYRVTLANLGSQTETYTLEVNNVDAWGTVRFDPSFVVVEKDSTGEAFVYVAANENSVEGLHMFTVKIKTNDKVIEELSLGTDVKAKSGMLDLTQILWIVFGALVLLVLILGIVLLVKRSGEDSDTEEPSMSEGQTYY